MGQFYSEEQPPPLVYSGTLKNSIIGGNLLNRSGIVADLNKAKKWPANWFPCPPYRGRSAWDNASETITFRGPWNEHWMFRAYLLGYATNVNGVLLREIPHQHPSMPWLYAMEAEVLETPGAWANDLYVTNQDGSANQAAIAFFDTSGAAGIQTSGYSDALSCQIAVTYRRPRYDVRTDDEVYSNTLNEMSRFLERQSSLAVDALSLPATTAFQLNYVNRPGGPGPGMPDPIPQGSTRILMNTAELTYIARLYPDIPFSRMLMAAGRVNLYPFDPPQTTGGVPVGGISLGQDGNGNQINGYPPGTVLCPVQPKYERVDAPNGRVLWDLICKFLVRIIPINSDGSVAATVTGTWATWNHFPVTSGGVVSYVLGTTDGTATGQPLYLSYDLNQIFTQPNPSVLYQGPNG